MDLDAIASALPARTRSKVDVDISTWIGQEPGTSVLTFQEPDASVLFTVQKDAELVHVRHSRWTDELCQSVALLALCHAAPSGKSSPGEFYTAMCANTWDVFLRVLQAFQAAFTGLSDWNAAVAEGKTD